VYKSYKLLPWIYFKIESANFIFIFDFTGNTSDLQEAISEGASSHSVGTVDLENDDDPDDNLPEYTLQNTKKCFFLFK
jgi:hypothetical protein